MPKIHRVRRNSNTTGIRSSQCVKVQAQIHTIIYDVSNPFWKDNITKARGLNA